MMLYFLALDMQYCEKWHFAFMRNLVHFKMSQVIYDKHSMVLSFLHANTYPETTKHSLCDASRSMRKRAS
jgi:hypothetical protein